MKARKKSKGNNSQKNHSYLPETETRKRQSPRFAYPRFWYTSSLKFQLLSIISDTWGCILLHGTRRHFTSKSNKPLTALHVSPSNFRFSDFLMIPYN